MFTITKGDTLTYPRAYALHLGARGTLVFVGTWDRLTAKRKATIARTALDFLGKPSDLADADLVRCFDSNPFCDRAGLTFTQTTITNDDDPTDVRHSLSYSYARGGGEWDMGTTHLHTVA